MCVGAKIKIQERKLLIVEGNDEENFFSAVLGNHLNIRNVQVIAHWRQDGTHREPHGLEERPRVPCR